MPQLDLQKFKLTPERQTEIQTERQKQLDVTQFKRPEEPKRGVLGKVAGFLAPTATKAFEKVRAGERLTARDIAGSALEIGSFLIPTGAIARGLGFAGKGAITAARAVKAARALKLGQRVGLGAVAGGLGGGLAEAGRAVGEEGVGAGEVLTRATGGAIAGAGFGAAIPLAARGVSKAFGGIRERVAERAARPARQAELLRKGIPETEVARKTLTEAGKVVRDPKAVKAIRQGVSEGDVAIIKGASQLDKQKMAKMLSIRKSQITNPRITARATDVVGDTFLEQAKFIEKTNREAGKRLGAVAQKLGGKKADPTSAITEFANQLDNAGVKANRKGQLSFAGSDFEGLKAPQTAIRNVWARAMRIAKSRDAQQMHRTKSYIDEVVDYGKSAEGLSGRAQRILKGFRRNVDAVLDTNFPEYNKVNSIYAETIRELDEIGRAMGRRFKLDDTLAGAKAGTTMRRISSNVQSRANILQLLESMQGVATKHGFKVKDDIINQALFADSLEKLLGTEAPTSFLGQVERGVARATGIAEVGADIARGRPLAATLRLGRVGFDIARGRTQENMIKALDDLLKVKPRTVFGKPRAEKIAPMLKKKLNNQIIKSEKNKFGKYWEKAPKEYVDVTEILDKESEDLFRGVKNKFESLEKIRNKISSFFGKPEYEAARQIRITTKLNKHLGKNYSNWDDVPKKLKIYRGEPTNFKIRDFNNYTFSKDIANEFAGKKGVVKEFIIDKDNIDWVNAGYVNIDEGEVLAKSKNLIFQKILKFGKPRAEKIAPMLKKKEKISKLIPKRGEVFGVAAGIETDEEGNIRFRPEKAAAGIAGIGAMKRLPTSKINKEASKLFQKVIKSSPTFRKFINNIGEFGSNIVRPGSNIQFHGTPNVKALKKAFEKGESLSGKSGLMGRGLYLTPLKNEADDFAKMSHSGVAAKKGQGGVATFDMSDLKIKRLEMGKSEYYEMLAEKYGDYGDIEAQKFADELKMKGFDGLELLQRPETVVWNTKKMKGVDLKDLYESLSKKSNIGKVEKRVTIARKPKDTKITKNIQKTNKNIPETKIVVDKNGNYNERVFDNFIEDIKGNKIPATHETTIDNAKSMLETAGFNETEDIFASFGFREKQHFGTGKNSVRILFEIPKDDVKIPVMERSKLGFRKYFLNLDTMDHSDKPFLGNEGHFSTPFKKEWIKDILDNKGNSIIKNIKKSNFGKK
jgi:hypothetical protein